MPKEKTRVEKSTTSRPPAPAVTKPSAPAPPPDSEPTPTAAATMVDVVEETDSIQLLLDWLSTFKGFHNKLALLSASNAGRGLFAYAKALQPGEPMLVIPSPSLLNPLTLGRSPLNTIPSELFPASASSSSPPPRSPGGGCRRLTTTQLLTLHLALSRDPKGRHNSEWEVFIKSLPSFRPFHPVTWVIPNSDAPHDPWWEELEACLSESVRIKIAAVAKRYKEDLKILRRVLQCEEPFKSQELDDLISDETFLWAWLNVNTRTVAMPLGLAEPPNTGWAVNNHSFVPLLDMINHSSIPHVICPKPEPLPSLSVSKRSARGAQRPGGNVHLVPGKVDLVLFAPLRGLDEGEEVTFLYGPHSNAMLFAEYGFTEVDEVGDTWWPNGDIDVTPWLDQVWEAHGGTPAKRAALEEAGLWGHSKLVANGGEPQPSVGLMASLCVMASPDDALFTTATLRARTFSRTAKNAARRQLARICEAILADDVDCRAEVADVAARAGSDPAKLDAVRVTRALLREEEHITKGVLELAESGGVIPGF